MAKLLFFGIPAHPILNDWPAALLPASLLCDAVALMGGGASWARSGYHTLMVGCASAAVAGAVGAMDYADAATGPDPDVRTSANLHAALNAGLGALFGYLLWQRSRTPDRVTPLHLGLSALGNIALVYSAWNGANMVYRHGVRIEMEPTDQPVELKRERAAS